MSKILLVGDDDGEALGETLAQWGYSVRTAASGRGAIDLGACDRPDVLVTDWVLGDQIHGLQLAAVLRLIDPSLPVVVTSGTVSADLAFAAGQLGATLLEKPCDPGRLRHALRRAEDRAEESGGAPVGVLRTDLDLDVVYANPQARRLLTETRGGERVRSLRQILSTEETLCLEAATDDWVEVWPVAEALCAWQVRVRRCPGAGGYLMVLLPGEQCLALVDRGPSYDNDFLVGLLLELPEADRPRWPFRGRALVIDASEMFRRWALDEIERTGTVCYSAASSAEARRLFQSDPEIGVVLFDGDFLSAGQRQLVADFRGQRPNLLMAVHSAVDPRHDLASFGLSCAVSKPWTIERLLYEILLAAVRDDGGGEPPWRPEDRVSRPASAGAG